MSDPKIEIAVTEDDLYAAISELYNSGSVEWVSLEGVTVTLIDPARCPHCGDRPDDLERHLELCTPY